jgi:hypothetical protein
MRTGAVVGVAVVSAVFMTACSAGSPSTHTTSSSTGSTAAASVTRWWSDSAAPKNSTIHASDPSAAAAKLRPNRVGYCSLLSQTQQGIASIAHDYSGQRLEVAVTAFLDELEALAPGTLGQEWRTVGSSILGVVNSQGQGGKSLLPAGVTKAEVDAASKAISADASSFCHLDLSTS